MSGTVIAISIIAVLVLVLSFFGWGCAVLALTRRVFPDGPAADPLSVHLTLGAALTSAVFFAAYLLGLPIGPIALLMKSIGTGLAVWGLMRPPEGAFSRRTVLFWLIFAPVLGVLVLASVHTPILHPDAQQYHVAFPWHIWFGGAAVSGETFLQSGVYLGFDLLYLGLGNLGELQDSPEMLLRVSLFNALASMILIGAAVWLAQVFGASVFGALLSGLAVFSMSPMLYWGMAKNDLVAAGVGVLALAAFHRASITPSNRHFFVAGLLAGCAVAVKITNLPILVLPALYLLYKSPTRLQTFGILVIAGCLTVLHWMIYSSVMQGTPFYPFLAEMPAEVARAWDVRNANGLQRSFTDAVTYFGEILLDRFEISGNQSLGWAFVVALVLSIAALIWRAIRRHFDMMDIIALSAILWLVLFYWERFDGRFLSRYIVICGTVFFAYTVGIFQIITLRMRSVGWALQSAAAICVVLAVNAAYSTKVHLRDARLVWSAGFKDWSAGYLKEFESWTALNHQIAELRETLDKPGVAVNDHFILFIAPPVVNVHAMHAAPLNLYTKDTAFLAEYLDENDIGMVVLRPEISGITTALEGFLDRCTSGPIPGEGKTNRLIFVITECKSAT